MPQEIAESVVSMAQPFSFQRTLENTRPYQESPSGRFQRLISKRPRKSLPDIGSSGIRMLAPLLSWLLKVMSSQWSSVPSSCCVCPASQTLSARSSFSVLLTLHLGYQFPMTLAYELGSSLFVHKLLKRTLFRASVPRGDDEVSTSCQNVECSAGEVRIQRRKQSPNVGPGSYTIVAQTDSIGEVTAFALTHRHARSKYGHW